MKGIKKFLHLLYLIFICVPYTAWVLFVLIFNTVLFTVPVYLTLKSKNKRIKKIGRWLTQRVYCRAVAVMSLMRTRFVGMENIDTEDPQLFIMNHREVTEYFIFQKLNVNFAIVMKVQFGQNPFGKLIHWGTKLMDYPQIDRNEPEEAKKVINESVGGLLLRNISIALYPEGTRTKDGLIRPFKKGAFYTAIRFGLPIVPVGHNLDYFDRRYKLFRPCLRRKVVIIGRPIPVDGLTEADVDNLLIRAREKVIQLNVGAGGPGGRPDEMFAPAGNPKKVKNMGK